MANSIVVGGGGGGGGGSLIGLFVKTALYLVLGAFALLAAIAIVGGLIPVLKADTLFTLGQLESFLEAILVPLGVVLCIIGVVGGFLLHHHPKHEGRGVRWIVRGFVILLVFCGLGGFITYASGGALSNLLFGGGEKLAADVITLGVNAIQNANLGSP